MESKKEKFKRIAEARTNKILYMIRLLSNCSNKNVYEYSEEEVSKIFKTIEDQLHESKKTYKSFAKKSKYFKL
jgi:hypothetical protein